MCYAAKDFSTQILHGEKRKQLSGVTPPQNLASSSCVAQQSYSTQLRKLLKTLCSLLVSCALFQEKKEKNNNHTHHKKKGGLKMKP